MTEHSISLSKLESIRDGSGHSIFGASGSHMFLPCPGSLIPNLLVKDTGSEDASYGTVAHGVTEQWLRTGRPPEHLLGTTEVVQGFAIEIDEQMFHYAEQCVDRCEWLPGQQLIEYRVDYSHLTPIPNQGGTLDFAALRKGVCDKTDHKFGKSPDNIVYAEENPQLMLYAIGVMRDEQFEHYKLNDFVLRINQPRLDHFDEWHTTRKRLVEFEAYAKERMALAWSFDAPRVAGPKQCRFCKVKGSCATAAKMQEDLLNAVFQDESTTTVEDFTDRLSSDEFLLKMANIGQLTIEQKAKLLPYRKAADAWWSALQADLEKHAAAGREIPGYKIVEGRSRRQFRDDRKAERQLLALNVPYDEIITEKLVSPAQAEKILTKRGFKRKELPDLLGSLIYKPPGKASLVPLSDKRPAIEDPSSVVFEDESKTSESEEEL